VRPPAAAGHRPMAGTRLGSAWRARGVKRPYSHRQGRVIFELRLTNQPGSRACPAGVPAVRGDSSRPDRPRPALNWRPPGEPVRVAPRCSQADAARAALPPCAGRAGQPSTLLHAPASPAHTGITGTARSSWASMPASGCRASCETGLAAAYLRAVIWDRGDRPGVGGSHGRPVTHAAHRFRRAAAHRRLLLAVRDRAAAAPDGARWRQCLRRHPVVLQGCPGMHRTLDLTAAPGTGRRG